MDQTKALEWISDVFAVKGRILSMKDDRMSVAEWDSLGTLLYYPGCRRIMALL